MKKIVSLLFSLLLMSCILTTHVCAELETHKHCICGKTVCSETEHDVNQEWTAVSSLPTDSGYYYLISDIELGNSAWEIASDKTIHLCLNGKTIYATTYINDYMINVAGKLTITDCNATSGGIVSAKSAAAGGGANGVFNVTGTLNIYDGNIICKGHGRDIVSVTSNGTANIYGGDYTNEVNEARELKQSNTYGFLVAKNGGQINVFDGNFVAKTVTNVIKNVDETYKEFTPFLINTNPTGKLNISGGYFEAMYYGYSTYSFDTTTLTGGTFKTKTSSRIAGSEDIDISKKVATNYELVEIGKNGPYQVKKIENFKIGKNGYLTLKEALDNAKSGDTIIVLKNCEIKEECSITNVVITVDLNGCEIKGIGVQNEVILIGEGGKLTLKDSSSSKSGKLYAYNTRPTLIRVNGGELVVNGGSYDIQVDNYVSYSHVINCMKGKVTINDGNFSILKGCDYQGENLYSSVVAATKIDSSKDSVININGGIFNCSYSNTETGKFASRIFTPYKGDNADYGTINVSGGYFNGDYNNPELTVDGYLNISGGSFDRNEFSELKLKDMIDTNNYYVKESGDPTRYVVTPLPKEEPKSVDYIVVNTCTK